MEYHLIKKKRATKNEDQIKIVLKCIKCSLMAHNYSILGSSCALSDSDFYVCLYCTTTKPKKILSHSGSKKKEKKTQGAAKLIIFPAR
jgi:hypothetical protein